MTLKLLLAEDDVELREVLVEALTLESFDVIACDNAEDALDIASEQYFDLALFDVVMTGMTGIEALSTLRRLHPNIGIIITTAFATVDVAVDAMKKGADEFLTKPFNLAALSVTLKRVHAERSPKSPLDERKHDQIFSALSNPIRRSVIKQLKIHRKMKFMDLCRVVGIEDHTKFNFHLKQLVISGLVIKEDGRIYSLTEQGQQVHSSML
ncbi:MULTISPECIES: response regulator [Vibrio]|jgi:DNA-binding NtrC family response regulator|uniref:ArsR family transcriptional regulator n=2 Tax=Vibrio TaxID=662 RepID=A0AAU9QG93_9VIBR|nr:MULTISPECIES: response regulator [Vibrio]KIP67921.1 ArsR family transcriptional regulator [Vibrio harveyi]KIP76681.1 ArsR family transcriptional regulator [Vibrio harveyi]MCF6450663.1 response regulator [Vibrio sp. MMG023]MCX2789693.1 response regulator [Vibrio sp. Sgm 5]NOJ16445.1 response regulator [Vibrio jasicida]